MDKKNMVKKQFDLQADKFSNWTITQNTAYMKQYFEFCEINKEDTLLDVACGTGEYAIYCAQRIKNVCGVDLSEKMIGIAKKKAHAFRLGNISFCTQDVAELSFGNGRFSVVNSKSTFHHFTDYQKIMLEIKRCCERGGKISIQDIIAYKNSNIDDYFEKLENLIDISHIKIHTMHSKV